MNVSEGKSEGTRLRVLWRRVVTLFAALAVAFGVLIAVPTAANATEEPMPTQDVNCDTISVNYHRPLVNGDHINVELNPPGGQVNMYVDQNIDGGASYNGQNNLGLRWKLFGAEQTPIPLTTLEQIKSGVITFNYGAAVKNLGINSWTVTFVQGNSSENWPNLPCGETPPETPLVASASVSVDQQATCDSPSTVKFDIVNATWDSEADITVGDHTRPATSIENALFSNKTNKDAVHYTIEDKKPSQSTDPSGDCYVPPTPPVVVDNNLKYETVVECGKVVVTATNEVELKEGETAEPAIFVYSYGDGQVTEEILVPVNETVVKTIEFPEDSGDHTVTVGIKGGEQETLTVHTDCEANPVPYIPEGPTSVDECGVANDAAIVHAELVESASSTDENGNIHKTASYVDDKGGYDVEYNLIKGEDEGKATVTYGVSAPNVFIPEPGEGDNYVLKDGFAVWTFQFTDEKCETVPPPTTPPTTPPSTTPPVPPVDHPKSPDNPQKPAAHQPPSVLASTGATSPVGMIGVAAAVLALGGFAMVATQRRRNAVRK